jgi:DNA gyrase subunit A
MNTAPKNVVVKVRKGMETREEDYVTDIFTASTKTMLLVFTDKGKVYWCKVHKLPLGSRTSKGKAIHNVVQIDSR